LNRIKKLYKGIQFLTLLLISAMLFSACVPFGQTLPKETKVQDQAPKAQEGGKMADFSLTSKAFKSKQMIPKRFTCDGENMNPPLSIEAIPKGTESLSLIVDDPDAPSGTWVHWLVWNIPPQFDEFPEGSSPPSALKGKNDFGNEEWGGPCPPPGPEHRYFFKLYALDTILELKKGATKPLLEKAMEGHILAQTELVGRYGRGR
jgi:Raf kinase inhibitor-like YbhB/YbcL family protein